MLIGDSEKQRKTQHQKKTGRQQGRPPSIGNINQDGCSVATEQSRLTQSSSCCVNPHPPDPDEDDNVKKTPLYFHQHSVSINQIMWALRIRLNHITRALGIIIQSNLENMQASSGG